MRDQAAGFGEVNQPPGGDDGDDTRPQRNLVIDQDNVGAPSRGQRAAVGTACGRNRVGYLIPCHRVIRETGALGGYHWGVDLKRTLLATESQAA